jgi:hypothetical protein
MLDNLAVAHAHDVDGFKVDSATGRRQAQKWSLVSPVIRPVSRHKFPVGGLPMDLRVEIGKRSTKRAVQPPYALLIGNHVWLWRVIYEIVSEELIEDVEVPATLHFFGIPADDGFRGIG